LDWAEYRDEAVEPAVPETGGCDIWKMGKVGGSSMARLDYTVLVASYKTKTTAPPCALGEWKTIPNHDEHRVLRSDMFDLGIDEGCVNERRLG